MPGRSGLPWWLRSLLAVLTVLASFLHQTRSPDAGGWGMFGLSGMVLSALMPGHVSHHSGSLNQARLSQLLSPDHHCGSAKPAARTTPLQTPVWTSWQEAHQHDAHCPFCLSNAFALEAGVTALPQGPPAETDLPAFRRESVTARSAPLSARARAPPAIL